MILHVMVASAAPFLLARTQEPIELRFEPPSGASLAISATESHDLLLESLVTRRGSEEPAQAEIELRLRSRLETVVADGFKEEAGRRRRRYLGLEGRLELVDPRSINEETGEWSGQVVELTSPFEGVSVAFQPLPGSDDRFGRHYDGRALREGFLSSLEAPFDWGRFLGSGTDREARSVSLGDRWSLPPEVLQPLLAPSGFLLWRGGEGADEQILRAFQGGVAGNLHIGFGGSVEGTVEATVKAIGGDSPESRFVEFEFKFDVTMRSDRTEFIKDNRIEAEARERVQTLAAQLAVQAKGGATLRWSVADQQPVGAMVVCDEIVELAVQILPPESEPVEQRIRMVGGLANRLEFREVQQQAPPRSEGR
ncbi:hypothetical protein N9Z54_01490 [Planctomycetota bacterium]|jgi:hypothetical protein|nr:hypothetical protein [Planctomycetota bacterium]